MGALPSIRQVVAHAGQWLKRSTTDTCESSTAPLQNGHIRDIVRIVCLSARADEMAAPVAYELAGLVTSTLPLAQLQIPKGVDVQLDLSESCWAWGREPRLRQVLLNFLVNAGQALGDARGRCEVHGDLVADRPDGFAGDRDPSAADAAGGERVQRGLLRRRPGAGGQSRRVEGPRMDFRVTDDQETLRSGVCARMPDRVA